MFARYSPARRSLKRLSLLLTLAAAISLSSVAVAAADSLVSSSEGESFSYNGRADVVKNLKYASGGSALRLYTNAVATSTQTFPAATRMIVKARKGAECGGAAAHVTVKVDGTQVLSTDVTATSFADSTSEYPATANITSGSHTFTVTNDSKDTSCDRAFRFDLSSLYGTAAPPPPAPSSFVTRAGTTLELDGQPYRFAGVNFFQANMKSPLGCSSWTANSDLDNQLDLMGPGHNVVRAWFFQRMATVNGGRDWSAFDHTLAVAKAHGYKVIATLVDQWNDCEGPYKDTSWYTGGYKTTVLPGERVPYRAWLTEVAARYRDDPAIAMWELGNEMEVQSSESNFSCPSDAATLMRSWADDSSTLVRASDPNHLISLGTGGNGGCGMQEGDYKTTHALPNLDVCSYHDYWGATDALNTNAWNGIQLRIDQCKALNKPIYAGESGIKLQAVTSLAQRASLFSNKFNAQLNAGASGFIAWNWSHASDMDYRIGSGDPSLAAVALP